MEAETEAVRATTIEIAHTIIVFGDISYMLSQHPTRQVNTGPAGCRARPQPKEKVLCGPVTHHYYISLAYRIKHSQDATHPALPSTLSHGPGLAHSGPMG